MSLWQSSAILLSSGVGAMIGAVLFGWLADRIGRRKVFLMTIGLFTVSTAALIVTPESAAYGWLYLIVFRFLIGLGAGGLYCVDLPLVQEFIPTRKRGVISGLITSAVPMGYLLGSMLVAFLAPAIGWRGLMAVCVALGFSTLLMRAWIPESPRWLLQNGRSSAARDAVAWALRVPRTALWHPPHVPMDFAAWMEVYLGGRWHTFDPRNNTPRTGRILIAQGRDAADVPLTPDFRSWHVDGLPGLDQ